MSIKFEKLFVGMVFYRVERTTGLQRFNDKWNVWNYRVESIDNEKREALVARGSVYQRKSEAWFKKPNIRVKPPEERG